MASRFALLPLAPIAPIAFALSLFVLDACSDDPATGTTDGGTLVDGSSSSDDGGGETKVPDGASPKDDAGTGKDATCVGPVVTTSGETCIGFGKKTETCDPSCGQPFGYVCFGGGPPGFTGCREQRVNATLGNTYCCPKNDCVAQPDRNIDCPNANKPKRFQCPPIEDGGNVEPPPGCVETNAGASNVEKYYCCP